MADFNVTEIKVCTVCIMLMCNGEYNDGTDAAEKCAERQDLVWGGNQRYFVPGSTCEDELRWGVCLNHCQGARNSGHILKSLLP
jgi:hypothetical protein